MMLWSMPCQTCMQQALFQFVNLTFDTFISYQFITITFLKYACSIVEYIVSNSRDRQTVLDWLASWFNVAVSYRIRSATVFLFTTRTVHAPLYNEKKPERVD